ncbi:MAG: YggS family pyridoxal phosphate-dependent enzyme [Lachnospiraceae bacterium]|nr:YggS family pyridoxal phosphate-dependent enzyme [Lachnospiraceae bacterium]
MEDFKKNLEVIEENICNACKKAGRSRDEVTLIAVSKTKPVEDLQAVYDLNIRDFGENKVQELKDKIEVMPKDMKWHMIGHLQRNKVKYIIGKVELIHSVDSLRLAEEISKQAKKNNVNADILIEVNIGDEESKFGISTDEVIELVKDIAKLENISIKGLMCVAPYVVDSEENRPLFHKIKDLSVDIMSENIDNVSMSILSMGMSNDYQVAIEEGATMVRIGSNLFGKRDYSKN